MEKREEVLKEIKPICDAFGIEYYDYFVDEKKGIERLVIEGQKINCGGNSISAIIDELIGYIFVSTFARNRSLGAFGKQTINVIKRYWV